MTGDGNRIGELDRKIDKLGESVSNGFERLFAVLSSKADRTDLDDFVRKDAFDERGKRVDIQIEELQRDKDRDETQTVQQNLIRQGQRYWWVPFVTFILRPDLLHGLATLLGGGPK